MATASTPPVEPESEAVEDAPDAATRIVALLDDEDPEGAVDLARSLHPAELGDALCGVDARVRELVIEHLDPAEIGAALGYMETHYREDLLIGLSPRLVAEVLTAVPDDVATDVIQELPAEEARQVVAAMPLEASRAVRELLAYADDTAGGRMTGQRVAVRPTQTVTEVIEFLRSLRPDSSTPFYVYVTDAGFRLQGVLNVRALLTAPPATVVGELMQRDLVSVNAGTDQEEAARLIKRYRLLALPVVDDDGHLLGTITSDDLLDVLEEEATEDIFRMAGVDEEEDLSSVRRSVRYRLPWLSVNLATALLAAYVVSLFEGTLARAAVLAAFMPVIAGQGGNAGIQTSTVVVRSIAIGRLTARHTRSVVTHELAAGLIMGASTGLAVALVALVWQQNVWLGLIVGIALTGNTLVGVTAGVLIPMGLSRAGQDPALSAGIWLTTFTDVLGFILFLGMGALLVERLA